MNELNIEATVENLTQVIAFVEEKLETTECKPKTQMQIETAVEELFVNIARYAYAPDTGNATVRVEVINQPLSVVITFIDHGVPYDPLAKEDPDVTLPAEERGIGGLGIYMSKQMMDDIEYKHDGKHNILKFKKIFRQ